MAWTTQNLTDLEAAILALATGAKSYAINGRSVTRENLQELRDLRKEMQTELGQRSVVARGIYDDTRSGG